MLMKKLPRWREFVFFGFCVSNSHKVAATETFSPIRGGGRILSLPRKSVGGGPIAPNAAPAAPSMVISLTYALKTQ